MCFIIVKNLPSCIDKKNSRQGRFGEHHETPSIRFRSKNKLTFPQYTLLYNLSTAPWFL